MKDLLKSKRKTIGVLINSIDGFSHSPLWKGINKVAEEKDITLLFFSGASLRSTWKDDAQQNVIYNLINVEKLDGLILCTSALINYIELEEFENFIEPYRKIPMISIATKIKDMPCIVFDNKASMRLMVNHLIEEHKFSRIAFIGGPASNPDANLRYQGYEEALKEHDISISRNLIVHGDFSEASAFQAIDQLLESNILKPEVVVAANDEMAIGAYIRLKQLGFEVGKDIALTGFDNIEAVKHLSPSFTTISQPLFQMAYKATQLISDSIDGLPVPLNTYLSGELIVRESCGCFNVLKNKLSKSPELILSKGMEYNEECKRFETILIENAEYIITVMIKAFELPYTQIEEYGKYILRLLNALIRDVKERTVEGEFIKVVNDILKDSIIVKEQDCLWKEGIYTFRNYVIGIINNYEILSLVQDLFYMASLVVGEIFCNREAIDKFSFKRMYIGTRDIMQAFNSALDIEQLTEVIQNAMNCYEIKQCYFCLYDTPIKNSVENGFMLPPKTKLVLGLNEGKKADVQYFDTQEMLPNQFLYQEKRNDFIFFQLFAREDHFGYIVLNMQAIDEFVFETFREQIGNALKSILLFDERKKAEENLNLAVMELEKLNGELRSIYVIDDLTGILNRRGFYIHGNNLYKAATITGGKFILCFGDLDGLKCINDTYGHNEGDEAIRVTAQILKESFEKDTIIARMGGDEFIMIAANKSSVNEINEIAEHITYNCDKYNLSSNKPYKIAISLGFSVYLPTSNCSFEDLIQKADKRLYEQKKKRKNRQ